MKLQRNNKYNKMIASVLLTSAILSGCSSAEAVVEPVETTTIEEPIETAVVEEPVEIVEDTEVHDIPKDMKYYRNYYKISDRERENRMARLDIKYPDSVHWSIYIKTIVVDDHGTYKVIPAVEVWDMDKEISTFYDLFTEEKLFDYPFDNSDGIYTETDYFGCFKKGFDFKKIKNAIPYFDDKEFYEFGVCFYAQTFFEKHIHDFRVRDGINYEINMDEIVEYYYDIPFNSDTMMLNTRDYADNYVTTVPLENQITSEELGLKCTYREEDKYFDFWKVSNEELNERASIYELEPSDEKISPDSIYTLVIKDADDNYKLMNTVMTENGETMEFYDFYTYIHLFDAPITSIFQYEAKSDSNHYFKGVDFKKIKNAIPYFDDKKIVKVDLFVETNRFISEKIGELRDRDGIYYKCPELSYYYNLMPLDNDDMSKLSYTKSEYLNNYLRIVPQDMQVTIKDLEMNLDKGKVKTLN